MPTVNVDLSDADKRKLEDIVDKHKTTQKDVLQSMVLYCIHERQQDWISYFLTQYEDGFGDGWDVDKPDVIDGDTDLNEGIRPTSRDDIIDPEDDELFEEARRHTQTETLDDVNDMIDSLGEGDDNADDN